MSTITQLSQHLVEQLQTITVLEGSVAVGIVDDPKSTNYKNIPVPFAVVRFLAERNLESSASIIKTKPIESVFAVTIHVPNGTEDILYNTSFPLLDLVRETIDGSKASDKSYCWTFTDGRVVHVDVDRMIYVQYYKALTPK